MTKGGIVVRARIIFGMRGVSVSENEDVHLGGKYSTITACKKRIKEVLPGEDNEVTCTACLMEISRGIQDRCGVTKFFYLQLLLPFYEIGDVSR